MAKELIIVESPAKARTISRFMGKKYSVKASLGHVRDLPKSRLGVDVDNDFAPRYVVPKEKKSVVQEIKKAAAGASRVYLATDPDREGEAISWHLIEAAELGSSHVQRVVFHSVTEEAIREAFEHPRDIDMKQVDAQQARRVLDRLVGYKISPLLWRKVRRRLSAGRVQSVALRMIVEREREILGFVAQEYWTVEAELTRKAKKDASAFRAKLVSLGKKKLELHSKAETDRVVKHLRKADYAVQDVGRKEINRQPAPPFITSTLQQEAWRKLRFTAKRTMAVAQQLYEGLPIGDEGTVGLITYMRTDSTKVADSAIREARDHIKERFGMEYLPARPRFFARKVKGAQEAHEAIRPTAIGRHPDRLKEYLNRDQARLYELVWKRMVASQMAAAVSDSVTVDISARSPEVKEAYLLRANSTILRFPGFLVVYSEGKDSPSEGDEDDRTTPLPELAPGEDLKLQDLFQEQHFTQPPARYTEATLVRALEEQGIGRPSTYAPIMTTLQNRDYVQKKEGRFYPQQTGMTVTDLLVAHFPDIINIGFTAGMEQKLDEIAQGQLRWAEVIRDFYGPFDESVTRANEQMPSVKEPPQPTDVACPKCGKQMVIRMGRYGKFLACSGFPRCRSTQPLPPELAKAADEKATEKEPVGVATG